MSVKLIGWEDVLARYRGLSEGAKNQVRYGFGRYLTYLMQYVKREKLSGQVLGKNTHAYDLVGGQVRWQHRPGTLKRTLKAAFVGDLEANVLGPVYGRAWEHGFSRRAFFVKPRVAKALVWWTGNSWAFDRKGHWISAQTFEAKPFVRPSWMETFAQRRSMVVRPLANLIAGKGAGGDNPYFKHFGRAA